MNTTLHSRIVLARRVAAACGSGVLLLGAAGCGSSSPQNAGSGATTTYGGTTQQGTTPGRFPGADGTVAAVNGSTAQVQSQQNGQVAVSWTNVTTFTKQVKVTLADVKVGDCVVVMPVSTGTSATAITAASVRITAPVSGSCSPTLRGNLPPGGGRGPQFNGTPPAGAGGGRFRGAFGAFGKVTAVAGNGFTVSSTRPPASQGGVAATTSIAVTTAASTTFSTTAKGAASDVKVGVCVRAQGRTDDTGAVTATSIAVSEPVGGQCGTQFFRGPGSGGPGTNGGQAS